MIEATKKENGRCVGGHASAFTKLIDTIKNRINNISRRHIDSDGQGLLQTKKSHAGCSS